MKVEMNMRLWHKDLIPVLPRQQLLAQWRELCAIVGRLEKEGTPNHSLVNKITEYPPIHFYMYINLVMYEMKRRGYKVSEESYTTLADRVRNCVALGNVFDYDTHQYIPIKTEDIYRDWHNDRYLRQCFYNLQEKYDCGSLEKLEYDRIESFMKHYSWKEVLK